MKVTLLPNTKKLKERIKQYGEIWDIRTTDPKKKLFLVESLCKKDLRWVEPDDIGGRV